MSNFQSREINNKEVWEKFLLSQSPGTFLQSWNWGEVNKAVGYKIVRLGFFEGDRICGLALMIHQPAKRGPHFLIPGGPVLDYQNQILVKEVFEQIKLVAKAKKVWFVRVRPDIKESDWARELFKKLGFLPAQMHVHGENTLVLDISRTEDELLTGMRKNTRYAIRKSLNEGYSLDIDKDLKRIDNLYSLQQETVKRHGFVGFQKKLFLSELEIFGKDNQALIFECKRSGNIMASAIVVFFGSKAFYHFSGSSHASRETNVSYFLQWEIIRRARSMGYKFYDFWGISPKEDPRHRFWGVTVFKKGFGGERVDWLHAHDLPLNPLYWATYIFEMGRKIFRRL